MHDLSHNMTGEILQGNGQELTLDFVNHLLEALPVGVIAYRADTGDCILANQTAARMIGATRTQVLAQNFRNIDSWKRTGLLKAAEQALATDSETTLDLNDVSTFGKEIILECTCLRFLQKDLPHLLLIIQDVAERRLAAKRLEQSREAFKSIFENMQDAYLRVNRSGEIQTANPAAVRLLRFESIEELIGRNMASEFLPSANTWEDLIETIERHGNADRLETTLKRHDNQVIWVEASIRGIRDNGGSLLALDGTFRDQTEKVKAQQERESILQLSMDMICSAGFDGRFRFVNEAFERTLGYSPRNSHVDPFSISSTPTMFRSPSTPCPSWWKVNRSSTSKIAMWTNKAVCTGFHGRQPRIWPINRSTRWHAMSRNTNSWWRG